MSHEITHVTRRAIADYLTGSKISWSGRLSEPEFLARLYDLENMPSMDHRFSSAASDISQHRIRNHDWNDDWVLYDRRFNLLHAPDEDFLRFLAETIHPVVRADLSEASALAKAYNQELAADGWELAEVKEISGKPVFGARKVGARAAVFDDPTGWQKVDRQLQEVRLTLEGARAEEQYQTVGLLCREVLISVAQESYDEARHPSLDGVHASDTDAKRMLEAVFDVELKGNANEEARAHAKAAVRLALALQHKRTADFRTAALCAEATASVVNLLAILGGRRGRPFS